MNVTDLEASTLHASFVNNLKQMTCTILRLDSHLIPKGVISRLSRYTNKHGTKCVHVSIQICMHRVCCLAPYA